VRLYFVPPVHVEVITVVTEIAGNTDTVMWASASVETPTLD